MRFYYENSNGNYGVFSEKDLIKAIYTAWNIEATLYIIPPKTTLREIEAYQGYKNCKLVFSPWDDNEMNNDLLEEYGYYVVDGEEEREIRRLDNNDMVWYDWKDVRSLV